MVGVFWLVNVLVSLLALRDRLPLTLQVYFSFELWALIGVGFAIWGVWEMLVLAVAIPSLLGLPSLFGALMFWGFLVLLLAIVAKVNPQGRC